MTDTENKESSWIQVAQNELFQGWQRWASFACIWVWTCLSGVLSSSSPMVQQLPGPLAYPNDIILYASVTSLFVALLFSKKIKTIVRNRAAMVVAGLILAIGTILASAGIIFDQLVWFIVGSFAGGFALSPLKIAWGEMYSSMKLQRGLVSMGYSLLFSMILVLLVHSLPLEVVAIVNIAAALTCAHLVFNGTAKIAGSMKKEEHVSGSITFSFSLLILPAIVALSYGLVKGIMIGLPANEMDEVMLSGNYADCLVGVIMLFFAYKLGKKIGPAQVYSAALICTAAGLLLLSSQSVAPWLSFFIHDVGFTLFYFFMVVYWGDLSWRTGMPIVHVYTIGYFTFQLLNAVGSFLGVFINGTQSQNQTMMIVLSIVLGLFVVVLLLFGNDRSSLRQWLIADIPIVEVDDEIPQACSEISGVYSLSPREQEVLGLLARGRTANYIARALYISPDTAKTHIKNIYRKLDVHAQQDLMDIIESTAKNQQGLH